MKLIIDISEEMYEAVRRAVYIGGRGNGKTTLALLVNAVINGTPLPKDATNGDVIKAIFKTMFPRFEIYENRDNEDYPYVDVIVTEHDSNCYPKDWWNAPYKGGKEDGKDTVKV